MESTQTQTTKMLVTGMTCGHCAAAVTEELQGVTGVTGVEIPEVVKGGDTEVLVTSDGPLDIEAAEAAVAEAGYTGRV